MSFSSEVKKELFSHVSSAVHCRRAELAAMLAMEAVMIYDEENASEKSEKKKLLLKSENKYVVEKSARFIRLLFEFDPDIAVTGGTGKNDIYRFEINNAELLDKMFSALKLREESENLVADNMIVERICCKRAFLRGCFLATGSVNNPEKAYHFEIVCDTKKKALQIIDIMKSFEINARYVNRKKYHIAYIKEGSMIVDVLNIMEAHVSLMNMENVRILKDVRNSVNRQVNCETANLNKTVSAAVKQLEDIKYIESEKGLGFLPPTLRQTAVKRLEEPEMSLKDLGAIHDPPIGKSGVNHRLKKITEIADKLKNQKI